jgi:eukaryotic-like serine/threonine-protein kinase
LARSVPFPGSERFFVERKLGAGGMGVVYQALDRERNQVVALKTLRDVDAASLVRFKREFRALADISHPHLTALYELATAGDQIFFTMELVDGVNLLRWVRGDVLPRLDASSVTDVNGERASVDTMASATSPGKRTPNGTEPGAATIRMPLVTGTLDVARLRRVLPQLAEGVAAIHDRGLLHRDLKPSNVLVTTDGRVKILDFGLVTEIDRERTAPPSDSLAGTAAYMSPEQGARLPLGPASDWYAVGVILYEALTGRLPFVGSPLDVLMDKQRFEPPPPKQLAPETPSDLDALCCELLRRDPDSRPTAREVLRRLGIDTSSIRVSTGRSHRAASSFIGRGRHMTALADAFAATRKGRLTVLFVHGSSGMGKSALVRRFLDGVEERDEALVVTGRCYERESVPYKAVDSIIDALSQHLARLPRLEAEGLMPRDVQALARLFPALRQVEAVTAAPRRGEAADPQELRRRAFVALRELLARLTDRRPLVIAIDDLQWGDVDSAALLASIVRPPDAPPLLLIASHRTEDGGDSAFLRQFRDDLLVQPDDVRELAVGALEPFESYSLALSLLDADDPAAPEQAERIAEEAQGNPFFIDELARHVRDEAQAEARRISLDEVLRARLRRLPPDAARLLAVIATAGRPIALAVAQRAAEVKDPATLALLKAGNLVRTRGTMEATIVECYHDRIRESQLALLDPPSSRRAHLRLAIALESSPRPDPEALAVHFAAAGERTRAAEFAVAAATQAGEALAFDRAARLYRLAIELTHSRISQLTDLERTADRGRLRILYAMLGEALANAGRGKEAAEAYLLATRRASSADVLELRRRAAGQLLLSGHFTDGIAALAEVLKAVDMRLYPNAAVALRAMLWQRLKLRFRGLHFQLRDESQIPQEQLTRVDVADAATTGLGMIDAMRAAAYQARHLAMALDTGEPRRIARALSAEAIFLSMPGAHAAPRVAPVIAKLAELADKLDTAEARGLVEGTTGLVAFQHGNWRSCMEHCLRAEALFRERCTGLQWEASTSQIFSIYGLSLLGRLKAFTVRLPVLLKESIERGDLYTHTVLQAAVGTTANLVDDQPGRARRELADAIARWNVPDAVHIQHFNALMSEVMTDLYVGDGESAWRRMDGALKPYERAFMLRVQTLRVSAQFARGRAAVAAGRHARPELFRVASADARALAKEGVAYARGLGALLEAAVAHARGDVERTLALLREAIARLEASEMRLHVEAARWELGRLIGGDDGAALVKAAEDHLRSEGVRDPVAMVATFTTGITR